MGQSVYAVDAHRQVTPFLESLKGTAYDFRFVREGLLSIHALDFNDGVNNQYQPLFNRIILSTTMNDGTKKIKRLEKLSDSDLGTLFHEAFHAYKANFIEVSENLEVQKNFLARRAQNLYRSIPESKRAVALEEAYASFVGWAVQAHSAMAKAIKRIDLESCQLKLEKSSEMWKVTWNSHVAGYWYRDSVVEYWSEKLKGAKILLTEGYDAYRDFVGQDGAHFVEEDLQPLDRRWIATHLLGGRAQESFENSFAQEIAALGCPTHPDKEEFAAR